VKKNKREKRCSSRSGGPHSHFLLVYFITVLESAVVKDPEEEYYTANRKDILNRVDSLLAEGDSEVALDTTSRYIDYTTEGSRLDSLHNVAPDTRHPVSGGN